jgi:hypothetical protein
MPVITINLYEKFRNKLVIRIPELISLIPVFIFILCFFLAQNPKRGRSNINAFHIEEFNLHDNRLQLASLLSAVLIFIVLTAIAVKFEKKIPEVNSRNSSKLYFIFPILITYLMTKSIFYGLFTLLIFLFISIQWNLKPFEKLIKIMIVFVSAVYCFSLFASFFIPKIINSENDLIGISSHFAMTSLTGWELVLNGSAPTTDYGFGITLLTALALKFATTLGITDINLYQIGLIYQLIFTIFIFFFFRVLNRKYSLAGFAVYTLLVSALYPQFTPYFYPNHSAMRYLFVILALFEFCRVISKNSRSIRTVYILTGVAILANPETGLPLLVGILFFSYLNRNSNWLNVSNVIVFSCKAVLFFCCLSLSYFIANYWILGLKEWNLFSFLMTVLGKGYGGLTSVPHVLILPILGINLLAIFRIRMRIFSTLHRIEPRDSFNASLAVISIVWLPYYFNRMDSWNLGLYVFIMVSIIINTLTAPSKTAQEFKEMRNNASANLAGYILIFSVCVGLGNSAMQLGQVIKSDPTCEKTIVKLSGLCLNRQSASEVTESLRFLSTIKDPSNFLVFSLLPTETRILGFNTSFPWNDPYSEIFTKKEELELLDWVDNSGPQMILIEKITSQKNINRMPRIDFFQSIISESENYVALKDNSHFTFYKRDKFKEESE